MANYIANYETTDKEYKIDSVTENNNYGANNNSFQLIPGEKGERGDDGDDGITPIKGVDYFTEADKEEILSQIESLTNIEIDSMLI